MNIDQEAIRALVKAGIEPAEEVGVPLVDIYHRYGQQGSLDPYDETLGTPEQFCPDYYSEPEAAPVGIDERRYCLYMLGQVCLTGRERDILNSST